MVEGENGNYGALPATTAEKQFPIPSSMKRAGSSTASISVPHAGCWPSRTIIPSAQKKEDESLALVKYRIDK